jgi:spermidine/putrescine transport system substrate-binding protein
MLDDMRELIGAALMYNGHSINSTDPKELVQAQDTIIKAKPYWAALLTDGVGDKVVGGQFVVAQWWSGAVIQTMDTQPDVIGYAIPREGTNGFQEDMCILASAPDVEKAKKFFEYMMRPEVNAKNTDWLRGWSTNKAALSLIDKALTSNASIYPDDETFKRLQILTDVGDKIKLYDKVWTSVKSQ